MKTYQVYYIETCMLDHSVNPKDVTVTAKDELDAINNVIMYYSEMDNYRLNKIYAIKEIV